MTLDKFKQQMRTNRGKLTNCDEDMENIYNYGVPGVLYYMLDTKQIGVASGADLAVSSHTNQLDFLKWITPKKTKNEIDSWLAS